MILERTPTFDSEVSWELLWVFIQGTSKNKDDIFKSNSVQIDKMLCTLLLLTQGLCQGRGHEALCYFSKAIFAGLEDSSAWKQKPKKPLLGDKERGPLKAEAKGWVELVPALTQSGERSRARVAGGPTLLLMEPHALRRETPGWPET